MKKVSIVFTVCQNEDVKVAGWSFISLSENMNKVLPIEFILVMNGSDNTRMVDKMLFFSRLIDTVNRWSFKSSTLHVIHIPVSIVEARQQGANLATGDWIIYLDAGQQVAPNRLEVLNVYTRDFYPSSSVLFNSYTVLKKDTNVRADYFPSIWRDKELDIVSKNISIANFIGIAHKKSLNLEFHSELEFSKQLLLKNIPFAYCDIVSGVSPEDRLIAGNLDYRV